MDRTRYLAAYPRARSAAAAPMTGQIAFASIRITTCCDRGADFDVRHVHRGPGEGVHFAA
jgi:hypothetical protein